MRTKIEIEERIESILTTIASYNKANMDVKNGN